MLDAGAGGGSAQDVRGGDKRSRRSERSATGGAERRSHADGLPRLPASPRKLPLHTSQMQVFPLQSPEERDENYNQGYCAGGRKEGAHAGMATGRQGRRRDRSGTQLGRGKRGQEQGWNGWLVSRKGDGEEGRNRNREIPNNRAVLQDSEGR
eukprot:6201166-Pleurochrysis_carterae.AAC.1